MDFKKCLSETTYRIISFTGLEIDQAGKVVERSPGPQYVCEGNYFLYHGGIQEKLDINFAVIIKPRTCKDSRFREDVFFRIFPGKYCTFFFNAGPEFAQELKETFKRKYRIAGKKLDKILQQAALEAIMNQRKPENKHIEDMSGLPAEKTNTEYLTDVEKNPEMYGYQRYNLGQVKKIIELVYLPHQVEQWNKKIKGEDGRPIGVLHREEKEVKLEEELQKAFEIAEKLFNAYTAIPQGSYYYYSLDFLKEKGCPERSSMISISRKSFQGFVTKEVDFEYHPFGKSIFVVPDWEIFIGEMMHHVGLAKKARFGTSCRELKGEDELRELIEKHWSETKAANKHVGLSRHEARKMGFYPETSQINSAQEMFEFAKRFLTVTERGMPFRENY